MTSTLIRHVAKAILPLVLVAVATPARAQEKPAGGPKLDMNALKLVWQDEFDGDHLDASKWEAPEMLRQGASRWVKSLVSVKDGMLHLGIKRTEDRTYRYDCGAVRTRKNYDPRQSMFQQRYGYFEARCRLPKNVAADYWGAFWMMAGDVSDRVSDSRQGTEIDIMETFTFGRDAEYNAAFHWNGYGKAHNAGGLKCGRRPQVLDGDFHRFGLYWDEDWYVIFLDGVEVGRTNMQGLGKDDANHVKSQGTCRQPAYLKLSCEAAPWAGKSNQWEKEMPAEDEFVVDYVRVYEGKLPAPVTSAGH